MLNRAIFYFLIALCRFIFCMHQVVSIAVQNTFQTVVYSIQVSVLKVDIYTLNHGTSDHNELKLYRFQTEKKSAENM